MKPKVGAVVRHETDPHARNSGVVLEHFFRRGHWLARVQWSSGVTEALHPDELVEYAGLLYPGESPRQARDRINGFKKD